MLGFFARHTRRRDPRPMLAWGAHDVRAIIGKDEYRIIDLSLGGARVQPLAPDPVPAAGDTPRRPGEALALLVVPPDSSGLRPFAASVALLRMDPDGILALRFDSRDDVTMLYLNHLIQTLTALEEQVLAG